MRKFEEFVRDERGSDMAEKAVIAVVIILATLAAWKFLGGAIAEVVNEIGNAIKNH